MIDVVVKLIIALKAILLKVLDLGFMSAEQMLCRLNLSREVFGALNTRIAINSFLLSQPTVHLDVLLQQRARFVAGWTFGAGIASRPINDDEILLNIEVSAVRFLMVVSKR